MRQQASSQLLGLDRKQEPGLQDMLWRGIFTADRFTSIVVGTSYSISHYQYTAPLTGQDTMPTRTPQDLMMLLAHLVGKVIDATLATPPLPYNSILALDQELGNFELRLMSEFDKLNPFASKDGHRTRWMDKLLGQFLFYHTKLILHLPYLLLSPGNLRMRYSHASCFSAARIIIQMFQLSRAKDDEAESYSTIDLIGYNAVITLLLGQILCVSTSDELVQSMEDWMLVDDALQKYRKLLSLSSGQMECQSDQVLLNLIHLRGCSVLGQYAVTEVSLPFFENIKVHSRMHSERQDEIGIGLQAVSYPADFTDTLGQNSWAI